MSMIKPMQIRAGRALVSITQADLAARAGISTTGLNNIERGSSDPKASTLAAIEKALVDAGVIFLGEGETTTGGHGVRLASG